MRYQKVNPIWRFVKPSTAAAVLGITLLILTYLINALGKVIGSGAGGFVLLERLAALLHGVSVRMGAAVAACFLLAAVARLLWPASQEICRKVKRGLFLYENGNPLHLQEEQRLPRVTCKKTGKGKFELTVSAGTLAVEEIQKVSNRISSSINGRKYGKYAVTGKDADIACNEVRFTIEDVTRHRELVVKSAKDICPVSGTMLIVQEEVYIDLTTSGSMLFCGKTRSGKTTGVIWILMQVLKTGRDAFGSLVTIIDPKRAELSVLPYVYTLDEDGEARGILSAVREYAEAVKKRQEVLNKLSKEKGDAVHWWDAGMYPSLLFIDEYVAVRTMFPKRVAKEDPDYSLASFDALIKQIVTMGASAGCYVIISIAEASVDEGGLPSMLRSAMSTKVLFRPTLTEGRFLWDSGKIEDFPERVYRAGEAWFSSTDGVHDKVTFVRFPVLKFRVYRELGRLLKAYYSGI